MKRLLSLLLALVMICALLPMSVLALDENETERDEDEGALDNSIACQINGHSYVGTLREASCEWYGCME